MCFACWLLSWVWTQVERRKSQCGERVGVLHNDLKQTINRSIVLRRPRPPPSSPLFSFLSPSSIILFASYSILLKKKQKEKIIGIPKFSFRRKLGNGSGNSRHTTRTFPPLHHSLLASPLGFCFLFQRRQDENNIRLTTTEVYTITSVAAAVPFFLRASLFSFLVPLFFFLLLWA